MTWKEEAAALQSEALEFVAVPLPYADAASRRWQPSPLSDAAAADCPEGHKCLFGWVPAHRFGHDDFGIYIDDIGVGETLQNGMIAEIIEQAAVESAVAAWSG